MSQPLSCPQAGIDCKLIRALLGGQRLVSNSLRGENEKKKKKPAGEQTTEEKGARGNLGHGAELLALQRCAIPADDLVHSPATKKEEMER